MAASVTLVEIVSGVVGAGESVRGVGTKQLTKSEYEAFRTLGGPTAKGDEEKESQLLLRNLSSK